MCDPLTIAVGLTAAGSAAQIMGQQKAQKAMRGAQEAERIRQKSYQSESDAAFAASKDRASRGSQDMEMAKAVADRKAAYDAATQSAQAPVAPEGANLAGDQAGNAVVASEVAKQSARGLGFAGQQGNAKAALQGYGDVQLGNAIYNARQLQEQARIGNAMQGSASILPLEMQAAQQKGQGLMTLGSALAAGGNIAGMGVGAGWWGKPAAQAAATAVPSTSALLPQNANAAALGNFNWTGYQNPYANAFKPIKPIF